MFNPHRHRIVGHRPLVVVPRRGGPAGRHFVRLRLRHAGGGRLIWSVPQW